MTKNLRVKVVSKSSQDHFARAVNESLEEGWALYGSPQFSHFASPHGVYIAHYEQMLTKEFHVE